MLLSLLVFLVEIILCIALPFYLTLRTVEKADNSYPNEYKRWATYWVLFIVINSFFCFIEIEDHSIVLPCRHGYCRACADHMVYSKCAVCRVIVTDSFRVYFG